MSKSAGGSGAPKGGAAPTMRSEFSAPLSQKRLAFSIQPLKNGADISKHVVLWRRYDHCASPLSVSYIKVRWRMTADCMAVAINGSTTPAV